MNQIFSMTKYLASYKLLIIELDLWLCFQNNNKKFKFKRILAIYDL